MWGSILGAVAGPLLNGLMGGGDSGGKSGSQAPQSTQQQTSTREPWSAAVPWLTENIASGQQLQAGYKANPFNPMQQQAYKNQFGNSDYFRSMVDSVLGQQNQQKPFDRSNPNARPQTYQMPSRTQPAMPTSATPYGSMGDLFGPMQKMPQAAAQPASNGLGEDDFDYRMWRRGQGMPAIQRAGQPKNTPGMLGMPSVSHFDMGSLMTDAQHKVFAGNDYARYKESYAPDSAPARQAAQMASMWSVNPIVDGN